MGLKSALTSEPWSTRRPFTELLFLIGIKAILSMFFIKVSSNPNDSTTEENQLQNNTTCLVPPCVLSSQTSLITQVLLMSEDSHWIHALAELPLFGGLWSNQ